MSVTDRKPIEYIARWHHLFPGLTLTPQAFYGELQSRISAHGFPEVRMGQVGFRESGVLSQQRLYLRVQRGDLAFDICGAPFGSRLFFSSSWLGRLGMSGCGTAALGCLAFIPGIGLLAEHAVRPMTCYEIDGALVFQEAVQDILTEYLDELCGTAGISPLGALERIMSMRNLMEAR